MAQQVDKPKVVPFKTIKKTDVQLVAEALIGSHRGIEEVVVLYKTKTGEYGTISNQGDAAGDIYFMERYKFALLAESRRPTTPEKA